MTDRLEDDTPVTTYKGQLDYQATLHGVLAQIRDTCMPLISVQQIKKVENDNP